MNTFEHILDKIKEANGFLDGNDIEDAVRLSGEALAQAYDLWQQKINSHSPSNAEVDILAIAASCHCNALATAGQMHDAYGTAVLAILQTAVDGNSSATITQSLLSLYSTALYSLTAFLSNCTPPDDETSRGHVEAITRYIASMLYHYYKIVGEKHPSCPYLEGAYQGLMYARNFVGIETDGITVNGTKISPSTPNDIIGDLIGRSNALGLIKD